MGAPVVPVAPILVVAPAGASLVEVASGTSDVELVPDVDAAVAQLGAGATDVQLVVIGARTPRPFSAARRIREAEPRVGLALSVAGADVGPTRDKLAFVPELAGVVVLADDADPTTLVRELRATVDRLGQQRQLRRALDAMNRGLAARAVEEESPRPVSVSERYLAALIRHLPEGVVSVDAHGRVVTINPSAADVLGVPSDESEGRQLQDLLVAEDPAAIDALLEQAAGGRAAERDDLSVRRADGDRLSVSLTAAPVTDLHGRVVGIVLLVRDVTEDRRTAERLRQLQKAESLATLAGGVAHDFNNLLVSVQSWAAMATEDVTDVELVTTALEHIRRASRRAAELARSMLAYAGRGTFELEPTDVNEVVGEMSGLLKAAISRKTAVVLEPAERLPPVLADATQLRQVVMNLVTNAAEAIGDGPGTIRLRTDTVEVTAADGETSTVLPVGAYVVVEVADSGPGMDEATLSRVFDPFFTTKFTGRGLGLAASHGIVRAHGGDIEVDSRPGQGARFRVLLPVEGARP